MHQRTRCTKWICAVIGKRKKKQPAPYVSHVANVITSVCQLGVHH